MTRFLTFILALMALVPGRGMADSYETVTFQTQARDGATLTAQLLRPATRIPAPAIVALHGCGGLWSKQGQMHRREQDWAERFAAAGYVVLFPDSYRPRGIDRLCETRQRGVVPRDRGADAAAAADWLARQTFVDPERIAVLGWSNGGSSVLWAVGGAAKPADHDWRAAIAFYPGCRVPAESHDWKPRVYPYVLIGAADNWTPPAPCRTLAERGAVRLIEYTGAVHDFDAPNARRRTRTGAAFSARGDGSVEVGTDPKARAAAIKEVMTILAEAFR